MDQTFCSVRTIQDDMYEKMSGHTQEFFHSTPAEMNIQFSPLLELLAMSAILLNLYYAQDLRFLYSKPSFLAAAIELKEVIPKLEDVYIESAFFTYANYITEYEKQMSKMFNVTRKLSTQSKIEMDVQTFLMQKTVGRNPLSEKAVPEKPNYLVNILQYKSCFNCSTKVPSKENDKIMISGHFAIIEDKNRRFNAVKLPLQKNYYAIYLWPTLNNDLTTLSKFSPEDYKNITFELDFANNYRLVECSIPTLNISMIRIDADGVRINSRTPNENNCDHRYGQKTLYEKYTIPDQYLFLVFNQQTKMYIFQAWIINSTSFNFYPRGKLNEYVTLIF